MMSIHRRNLASNIFAIFFLSLIVTSSATLFISPYAKEFLGILEESGGTIGQELRFAQQQMPLVLSVQIIIFALLGVLPLVVLRLFSRDLHSIFFVKNTLEFVVMIIISNFMYLSVGFISVFLPSIGGGSLDNGLGILNLIITFFLPVIFCFVFWLMACLLNYKTEKIK